MVKRAILFAPVKVKYEKKKEKKERNLVMGNIFASSLVL